MSFASLGLSAPLVAAVTAQGYATPSPIQAKAIPVVLQGNDLMAAAQTGTGKTAGFTLPLLERLIPGQRAKSNQVRALILTPTRELAAQVADSVATYSQNTPLRSTVVFGGVKINPQMQRLRGGVDILVATPGRLLDLYNQNAIRFNQLEILVLDEADRMLDMGFIHDIRKLLKLLPSQRQNLLFSATFSPEIRALASSFTRHPLEISVAPPNSTANSVEQRIYSVDKARKSALLKHLITEQNWTQVLVFSRTKHGADKLSRFLVKSGLQAAAIHGNKAQGARTRALAGFKNGNIQVLVATDIAARGLDIDQLPQVVNFDLPDVAEDYVHRIGRTGRAGANGQAISLVCADELKKLRDIERLTNRRFNAEVIAGFEPEQTTPVADTERNDTQRRANRPKRKRQPGRDSHANAKPSTSHTGTPASHSPGKKPQQNRRRRTTNKPQQARAV